MAMTMAMSRLHALLDSRERYPLPPREIIEQTGSADGEDKARAGTLTAHFGFGALTGVTFAFLPASKAGGMLYGVAVWAFSYLGWIPAAQILAPLPGAGSSRSDFRAEVENQRNLGQLDDLSTYFDERQAGTTKARDKADFGSSQFL